MLKGQIEFKKVIHSFSRLIILVAFLILYPSIVLSKDTTLQWDANTEPDLAGYTVYWSETSGCPLGTNACDNPIGPYTHSIYLSISEDENPLPEVVEYTIVDLHPCISWKFVVDAVDNQDLHSGFSNQVSLMYVLDSVTGIKQ